MRLRARVDEGGSGSRRPRRRYGAGHDTLDDLKTEQGDALLPLALDVTNREAAFGAVNLRTSGSAG